MALNFETAYRIAANLCLYLKTSLVLSTALTNTIIRQQKICEFCLGHTSKLWYSLFFPNKVILMRTFDHEPETVASCSRPEKYKMEKRTQKEKRDE